MLWIRTFTCSARAVSKSPFSKLWIKRLNGLPKILYAIPMELLIPMAIAPKNIYNKKIYTVRTYAESQICVKNTVSAPIITSKRLSQTNIDCVASYKSMDVNFTPIKFGMRFWASRKNSWILTKFQSTKFVALMSKLETFILCVSSHR